MRKIILFLVVISVVNQGYSQNYKELHQYLESNWQTPEEYVISKFKDHDYVFIGEYHRIKHDVELILNLIPQLYENGIFTLGIEFGDYNSQALVDSMLTAPVFDRDKLRKDYFKDNPTWGYKEYLDIYETAWKVNKANSTSVNKFRVVNLVPTYDPCKKGGGWKNLDPDEYMADIITKEIVNKNQKALIYSGTHHAFTKYHQPYYDFDKNTLDGFTTTRMGNIIYDALGEKTFNIYLHAGWTSSKGWDAPKVLPVDGVIDSVMSLYSNKRVGFDVVNTPFGQLKSTNSYYALGYDNFTLDKYCDGYIYQNALKNYQPITMEENFYTDENISELKNYLKCIGYSENDLTTLSPFNAGERMHEDIRNHFKHLMK